MKRATILCIALFLAKHGIADIYSSEKTIGIASATHIDGAILLTDLVSDAPPEIQEPETYRPPARKPHQSPEESKSNPTINNDSSKESRDLYGDGPGKKSTNNHPGGCPEGPPCKDDGRKGTPNRPKKPQ